MAIENPIKAELNRIISSLRLRFRPDVTCPSPIAPPTTLPEIRPAQTVIVTPPVIDVSKTPSLAIEIASLVNNDDFRAPVLLQQLGLTFEQAQGPEGNKLIEQALKNRALRKKVAAQIKRATKDIKIKPTHKPDLPPNPTDKNKSNENAIAQKVAISFPTSKKETPFTLKDFVLSKTGDKTVAIQIAKKLHELCQNPVALKAAITKEVHEHAGQGAWGAIRCGDYRIGVNPKYKPGTTEVESIDIVWVIFRGDGYAFSADGNGRRQ